MFRTATIAAASASLAMGAPLHRSPVGESIPGQYIVRLAKVNNESDLASQIQQLSAKIGLTHFKPKATFGGLAKFGFGGFSVELTEVGLQALLKMDIVDFVEENKMVEIFDCKEQTTPDWGLTRTNIRGDFVAGPYDYTTGASGTGVDAYIIDTGIYCQNNDFVNKVTGSCVCGADFVDGSCVDGNGHGTHCAGTVAGITYGVAKEADLIAVRVLNDAGSGTLDGVIQGIDWTVQNAQKTGKPSVANLSLGSSFSQSVNDAVEAAVAGGVNMLVAAGNNNKNACNYSPASAPSAVTVGATEIDDDRASYSNYGKCLDIFGPGTDITSAWIGSPSATKTISGTSMATPHVCGVAAKYLSADPSLTTANVTAKLISDSTKNVVNNADGGLIPSADNVSPNRIVYGFCT